MLRLWRFAALGVCVLLVPARPEAASCTTATASCTEWIEVPGSVGRLLVAGAIPPTIAAGAPGFSPPIAANAPAPFMEFTDRQNCSTYDKWPYGLQERSGYAGRIGDDQLKKQLAARPATYLLGALDILPLFNFDGSCPAMAQGPTRLALGVAYTTYVNERYGAKHAMVIVPACGHNGRCMFTDNAALKLIFPE